MRCCGGFDRLLCLVWEGDACLISGSDDQSVRLWDLASSPDAFPPQVAALMADAASEEQPKPKPWRSKKKKAAAAAAAQRAALPAPLSPGFVGVDSALEATALDLDASADDGAADGLRGLCGSRADALALLADECEVAADNSNVEARAALQLWRGDAEGALLTVARGGKLSERWAAVAPLLGRAAWEAALQASVASAAAGGDVHGAVLQLLAAGRPRNAVGLYRDGGFVREALLLAKVRLDSADDGALLSALHVEYAQLLQSASPPQFAEAAQCYAAAGGRWRARALQTLDALPAGPGTEALRAKILRPAPAPTPAAAAAVPVTAPAAAVAGGGRAAARRRSSTDELDAYLAAELELCGTTTATTTTTTTATATATATGAAKASMLAPVLSPVLSVGSPAGSVSSASTGSFTPSPTKRSTSVGARLLRLVPIILAALFDDRRVVGSLVADEPLEVLALRAETLRAVELLTLVLVGDLLGGVLDVDVGLRQQSAVRRLRFERLAAADGSVREHRHRSGVVVPGQRVRVLAVLGLPSAARRGVDFQDAEPLLEPRIPAHPRQPFHRLDRRLGIGGVGLDEVGELLTLSKQALLLVAGKAGGAIIPNFGQLPRRLFDPRDPRLGVRSRVA